MEALFNIVKDVGPWTLVLLVVLFIIIKSTITVENGRFKLTYPVKEARGEIKNTSNFDVIIRSTVLILALLKDIKKKGKNEKKN